MLSVLSTVLTGAAEMRVESENMVYIPLNSRDKFIWRSLVLASCNEVFDELFGAQN
jgi:hypothetical protein